MIKNEDLLTGREFKKNIQKQLSVFEVIIFGSRARGDASIDSDLDVLVVLDNEAINYPDYKENVYDAAWETGLLHKVVISTVIVTRGEVTQTALRSSPLIQSIRKEGVVV